MRLAPPSAKSWIRQWSQSYSLNYIICNRLFKTCLLLLPLREQTVQLNQSRRLTAINTLQRRNKVALVRALLVLILLAPPPFGLLRILVLLLLGIFHGRCVPIFEIFTFKNGLNAVLWHYLHMMSKRLGYRSCNGDFDGMFKQGLSTGLFFLNKKAFQSNANFLLSDSPCIIVNKFDCVWKGWEGRGGGYTMRSNLNKFEHARGGSQGPLQWGSWLHNSSVSVSLSVAGSVGFTLNVYWE